MESNVYLRRAGREDVEIFFKWVNEPAVRANSFNQNLYLGKAIRSGLRRYWQMTKFVFMF